MLNQEQQFFIRELVSFRNSEHKEMVLTSKPGCGKSFLIQTVLNSNPYNILVSATTGKAAGVISSALPVEYEINTIHKILGLYVWKNYSTGKTKLKKKNRGSTIDLEGYSLLVIDECSMIDRELDGYIQQAIADINIKVLYVGDANQLPPVNGKSVIFDKGLPTFTLNTIMRQKNAESIKQSDVYRDIIESKKYNFSRIHNSSNIKVLGADEIKNTISDMFLSDEYLKDSNYCKCLLFTNGAVHQYNKFIRDLFVMEKFLVGDKLDVEFPAVGEIVVANSAYMQRGVTRLHNEEIVTVIKKDNNNIGYYTGVNSQLLVVERKDGTRRTIGYSNDRADIKKTKAKMQKDYNAGELEITKLVDFEEYWADLRPIYASTVHKSQGSTYTNVFIDLEDIKACNKDNLARILYVAMTRATDNVYIYGNF